jgi:hypothetical protein
LTGKDVPQVYADLRDGKVDSIGFVEMQHVLRQFDAEYWSGYLDEYPLSWSGLFNPWLAFGLQARHQQLSWFKYVQMAMEAGYYGLANVDFHRKGASGQGPNHWVLLCGFQTVRVEFPGGGARMDNQVLVSCSATSSPDEEWVNVGDFLTNRGGFNLLLVRPTLTTR